jgi:hypothetical protein
MKIKGGPGQYKEDLMVGINWNGYIYYIDSNRDGTFKGVSSYYDVTTGYTYGIGLGDFDGDNDLDIVFGAQYWSWSTADFFIIENTNYNNGNDNHPWGNVPNIQGIGSINTSGWNYVFDLAVEDFDNDGNLDFISNLRSGTYYLFKGKGDLSFKPATTLSVNYPGSYAMGKDAADMNNDGNMDFVSGGTASGTIYYYEGNGDGTFKNGVGVSSGPGNYQYSMTTADFDDDFNMDIITKGRQWGTSNYNMQFVKGQGDGKFNTPQNTNIQLGSWWYYAPADAFDFNYDGYQDMMVLESSTFYYYKGLGNGANFATKSYVGGSSSSVYSVAAPPRMPLGGCQNLTLDIGSDASQEISFYGEFDSEKTVYFGDDLNTILGSSSSGSRSLETFVDDYGNEMVKIPLRFDSDTIGSVMLHDIDIKYDYTATVELLPGERYNLTTDLNDLIPPGDQDDIVNDTSSTRVHFGMYSDTPGKVTLSDLNIEYNGAPSFIDIPTLAVSEDSDTKALDLTQFFTDDYDTPSSMSYGVSNNHNPEHIALSIIDNHWLRVNSSLKPDWHGNTMISVWCTDLEGIRTHSNLFKLKVTPVDDPPVANNPLPNAELRESESKIVLALDDPTKDYFIDVDSEDLYYRAMLETPAEHSGQLTVEVLKTNELRLTSISTFGLNIGVRVYCDDDESIKSLSDAELKLLDASQLFLVNITSRTRTFPPQWQSLSIPPIPEDTAQENILKLSDYVTDEDDKLGNLTYSIYSLTQSGYIDIAIDDETSMLSIYPRDDFDSKAKVTLAVTDDEQNRDLTTLLIEMIPYNDLPQVEISEPSNGTTVRGLVEIIGSAYDPEGDLSKVEISIGDGAWLPVDGLGYWTYMFDVSTLGSSVGQVVLKARAEDGTGSQSLMDRIYLNIQRQRNDRDEDGVIDIKDKFPDNPSEWQDSDGDTKGDNKDKFPEDVTQWDDTDGDGYGDVETGNNGDKFPYDPTQWFDADLDGHGDNDWGNSGDHHPYNPKEWEKEGAVKSGDSDESSSDSMFLLILIGLVSVIIFTGIIFVNYGVKWLKTNKTK